jgi:hypothetical protein
MTDDLTLYHQVRLIAMCHNYTTDRVLKALAAARISQDSGEAQNVALVDPGVNLLTDEPPEGMDPREFKKKIRREMREANKFAGQKKPTLLEAMNMTLDAKILGKAHHDVLFSPRAIWNMYLIDSTMMAADYSVRIEILAQYLDRISAETIGALASEKGHIRMAFVLSEIEEYFGIVEESAKTLAHTEEVRTEPTREVDPEAVKVLENALGALRESEE